MITAARSHIERRLAGSAASALTKGKSSGAPMSARTFWRPRRAYLQIRVQSLCTLRGHCRQGPRNIRYQAGGTPYSDRSSTGWIAPACLAHSFDHLVGAGERRLRGGDARPFCVVVEPGEDTRTLSTSNKCHLRVRRFIEPSHRV